MKNVIEELDDDVEAKQTFYWTIFEKMHISLPNIKSQLFPQAD